MKNSNVFESLCSDGTVCISLWPILYVGVDILCTFLGDRALLLLFHRLLCFLPPLAADSSELFTSASVWKHFPIRDNRCGCCPLVYIRVYMRVLTVSFIRI